MRKAVQSSWIFKHKITQIHPIAKFVGRVFWLSSIHLSVRSYSRLDIRFFYRYRLFHTVHDGTCNTRSMYFQYLEIPIMWRPLNGYTHIQSIHFFELFSHEFFINNYPLKPSSRMHAPLLYRFRASFRIVSNQCPPSSLEPWQDLFTPLATQHVSHP